MERADQKQIAALQNLVDDTVCHGCLDAIISMLLYCSIGRRLCALPSFYPVQRGAPVTSRPASFIQQRYVLRIMASLAFTLLLLIGVVRFWPASPDAPSDAIYNAAGEETIQIEEIVPTSQTREQRPPPPAPLPPVVVPNDVIDAVEPIDFTDAHLPIENPGQDATHQDGTQTRTVAARQPDVNARLLRYVEPEYPQAARRRDVRAEVVIEVNVNPAGQVTSASIVRRTLLGDEDTASRTVDKLGYGLEEAALAAARQCLFRPAQANGEPVATRTTLTIRFSR